MKIWFGCALLYFTLFPNTAFAEKKADGYPYDRSITGCVTGNCESGFGTYVYNDDDYYAGQWADGKRHGEGVYFIVDEGPWSDVYIVVGRWRQDKQHGKMTYTSPNGNKTEQYWYNGEDVTSRVANCRRAGSASEAYKGFVAIINGLAAAARGDDILEGAARGYDAADRQILPTTVDLTCSQLLQLFE